MKDWKIQDLHITYTRLALTKKKPLPRLTHTQWDTKLSYSICQHVNGRHSCAKRLVYKHPLQCAKKMVSDSPGLVDFAIGQRNFVLKRIFLRYSNYRRNVKSILLIKTFLGLVQNDVWASRYYLQLARMASCKTDFLCTLLLMPFTAVVYVFYKIKGHYLWHFSMPSVNCFDYVIALFTSSYCWHKPVVSCNQGSARRPQYYNWSRIWLE